MRTNECTGSADFGPCQSSIERWFYHESSQKCKPFKYSGCGGNGNNYPSKETCQQRCAPLQDATKCFGKVEPLKNNHGNMVSCAKTDCPAGYQCHFIQETSICCPDTESFKGNKLYFLFL